MLIAPVTFMAAPIETSLAPLILRAESWVEPPTAPVNVTEPAFIPRTCAPFSEPAKRIFPAPVFNVTFVARLTAFEKVMLPPDVLISWPIVKPAEPVRETVPEEVVKVPLVARVPD